MKAYLFPGQGSQQLGMGDDLFQQFPEYVEEAGEVLGYPITELCLKDPNSTLNQTQCTQPALYTVGALDYLRQKKEQGVPDYAAGHSLGEYTALFAAGAFDFATGLKLVQKRGELMAQASGGGMAAIIGLEVEKIQSVIDNNNWAGVQVANYNAPSQTVITGPAELVHQSKAAFEESGCQMFIPLKVSGAFHSSLMQTAQTTFAGFIASFSFGSLDFPVISNVQARPYSEDKISELLTQQITHSVQWTDSIRYLMGKGVDSFEEMQPGKVLTGLVRRIQREATPLT